MATRLLFTILTSVYLRDLPFPPVYSCYKSMTCYFRYADGSIYGVFCVWCSCKVHRRSREVMVIQQNLCLIAVSLRGNVNRVRSNTINITGMSFFCKTECLPPHSVFLKWDSADNWPPWAIWFKLILEHHFFSGTSSAWQKLLPNTRWPFQGLAVLHTWIDFKSL